MKEKDVRDKLLTNSFALSDHMLQRVGEQRMYNINQIIYCLAEDGAIDEGFNQKGINWSLDGVFRSVNYRLIVGPHGYSDDFLYIITLFKVFPGIERGQNYQKYSHKELIYTFTNMK